MNRPVVFSCLSIHPVADARFRHAVERACSGLEQRPIGGPALLAAVTASLQLSYPLATVQSRPSPGPRHALHEWDAFRDGTVLDDELLERARAGQPDATGQLYDRHHALAYDLAMRTALDAEAAMEAVIEVFRALLVRDDGHLSVRVRIARGARDVAQAGRTRITSDQAPPDPLTAGQRTVIELARTHRLLGAEIASVLRLDIGDVRRLANEGLAALGAGARGGAPIVEGSATRPGERERPVLVPTSG